MKRKKIVAWVMALCWPEINGVKARWERGEGGEGEAGQLGDAAQAWRVSCRGEEGRRKVEESVRERGRG